jgi:hypothetical protein
MGPSLIQEAANELADNWPAFVYILLTIVFSFLFLRQRRAEARIVKEIGDQVQEAIRTRFDHLERVLVRQGRAAGSDENRPLSS